MAVWKQFALLLVDVIAMPVAAAVLATIIRAPRSAAVCVTCVSLCVCMYGWAYVCTYARSGIYLLPCGFHRRSLFSAWLGSGKFHDEFALHSFTQFARLMVDVPFALLFFVLFLLRPQAAIVHLLEVCQGSVVCCTLRVRVHLLEVCHGGVVLLSQC